MMQKYQEKPIALIHRDNNGKYKVNQEALQLFASVDGKLAIISVAGIYRTGKSFLLNTMLLNCKNGFAVGPTVNPKTKGIWVWGKPLIFKNQHDEIINVLVLDSEGLGSTQQDINHDLRLFSITLLLSSAFMYNTVGAIDENAIDRLGLVLRLCEHLKNQNYNDFPDFYWILRDFSLALVDKNNIPLTTKAYLQNCLSNQPSDSQYRNKIRQSIKQAFQIRNCYTFVRPLMNQQSLQNLDKMQLEQLRPQFVEQVIQFRKSIFGNLRVKSIKGRQIRGSMLCDLISIYVECINSDKLPVIESGWQQLCLKQLHEVLQDIESAVAKRVRDIKQNLPRTKKQLLKQQQILYDEFQQIFAKRLKNNDKAKQYFSSVQQIISKQLKGVQEEMKVKNSSETQAFVRKQLQGIQKRLKAQEFKNMGQLVKQFEIFYEYYRKKCPYKDQIQTGLELLLKKFSDCSLILFKNNQNKKDSQIQQLRTEIQNMLSQFSSKQQKYKQERNILQDKIAKLQTNLDDLIGQNNEMAKHIEDIQAKLDIAENMNNNTVEEELSYENIMLKKKIMDIQNHEKQLTCLHSQEMNLLKQEILLKSNEAEYSQKQRGELIIKIQQLELSYKNCKQLNEQKIHQLISQVEKLNQKSNALQKALKSKLSDKQQLITELEKVVELKNQQILQINNKSLQQTSLLAQMTLQEERKVWSERQKQLTELKHQFQVIKQNSEKRIKELQAEIVAKDTQYKISKLSIQQEKALLAQKIEFIKKQSEEKHLKNQNLQQQIHNYVQMIEEKDRAIQQLNTQLEQLKNFEQIQGQQIQKKINEMLEQLQSKNNQITILQNDLQTSNINSIQTIQQRQHKISQLEHQLQKSLQEIKNLSKQITQLKKIKEESDKNTEQNIQIIKMENQRYLQDQKRNAEMSLVQLKNFYQMEKQRLEKRLLEQRKKYQYNETNLTMDIKNKYNKEIKALTEYNKQITNKMEEMEQLMTKSHNQYEIKILGLQDDLESQKKIHENQFALIKRKYDEVVEELSKTEKQHEEDRISFVKKIEGINFQLSKKEKQILQLSVKKQSLQSTISKKDTQIQNLRKSMNNEIENCLKKITQLQIKYQKINEQYSNYKIEIEKENALLKQQNEFLNIRIHEMGKDKDIGSIKNLDKIQRNKINDLKEQLDRQKSQNNCLEAKIENIKKNQKDNSNQFKKQINELQKDNMFLKQKIQIYQTKINQLEVKITQKTQMFKKEVDEMRNKHNLQRQKLQNDFESQRQKLNQIQDEKKSTTFKLQMQLALVTDKITHAQIQRDQNKKELDETQKRLQVALNQLKKQNQKNMEINPIKKNSIDKRFSNQIELMKMSSKARQEEFQQNNKKLKEEIKIVKEKNFELQDKLNKCQKLMNQERNYIEEIEKLKREKEKIVMAHRSQLLKESDQAKKKYSDLQKRNRELQRQNSNFLFSLEKEKAKANMEKQQLSEKVKQLEDMLAWEKKKTQSKVNAENSKNKLLMSSSGSVASWK